MSNWKEYKNGNTVIRINAADGTREMFTKDDEFDLDFPISADVCITKKCDGGCKYCFTGDTKILMGDFSYKDIKDIKVGDEVIGFDEEAHGIGKLRKIKKTKVIKTFCHVEEELIKIKTESGLEVVSTPNHPFLSEGNGKNHSRHFSKIEKINVGKYVFSIRLPYETKIDYNGVMYKLGYTIGAWCGDGTRCHNIDKNGYDMFLCRFVTKDDEINQRVMNYTSEFVSGFYFNDFNMKDVIANAVTNASKEVYNKINSLINEHITKENSIEYAAGFCAGMYDSEGSIDKQRKIIRISNTTKLYLDELMRCIEILGMECVLEPKQKNNNKNINGNKPIYNVRIKGRHNWTKFLWFCRPVCVRKSMEINLKDEIQYEKDTVVSKEMIFDKQYVYNFSTETRTYIANNYLVHNCYEGCATEGKHGKLDYEFLNHLHPYTELAVNGNDLSHPDLLDFLARLKEQKVFVNMTVNQIHFDRHKDFIDQLLGEGLIKGLGISVVNPTAEFVNKIKPYENVVLHVINGIFSPAQYEVLKDNDLKVLILGYKDMRRGEEYLVSHISDVQSKMNWMYDNIDDITKHFKVTCFDNLALEQLNVRRLLSDEEWEVFYNGADGSATLYVDLVAGTFSKNSVAPMDKRYPIEDFSMDEMFQIIKTESKGYEVVE